MAVCLLASLQRCLYQADAEGMRRSLVELVVLVEQLLVVLVEQQQPRGPLGAA